MKKRNIQGFKEECEKKEQGEKLEERIREGKIELREIYGIEYKGEIAGKREACDLKHKRKDRICCRQRR